MVQRLIQAARFPAVKSLDTFGFSAIPSVNKALVMERARCEYIQRRENVIAVGNSGAGKTHVALELGLAACQRGMPVGSTTAALVHESMEARDERRLLNLQRQLSRRNLLIVDELGFVPLSRTGGGLLFEVFSQRYERGSILVTTNLPLDEWAGVFGSERLTGALLDRLTHHVHILEMNGDSYRLKRSRERAGSQPSEEPDAAWLTLTLASLAPKWARLHLPCRPRSSGRWYTIPPPQWYGLPTPLTPVPAASGTLPKNSRQGDGALQAFEVGCGVPVGGLQADYEASARLPKTETRNLLDGHSSWWRLRAEAVNSYLKMPFWRALVG